jgi:hypothetical protein
MRQNYADPAAQPDVIHKLDASDNADAAASKAADVDNFWVVDWIAFSYDGTPTGGKLTVAFGSTTLLELDIAAAGPHFLDFSHRPLYNPAMTKNEALTITLAAGGASVAGKVSARIR